MAPKIQQPVRTTSLKEMANRIASGAQAFWTTAFGPGQPLQPREPAGEAPRTFDYIPGANLNWTPRSTEAYSFDILRALADNLDLLRVMINARIDQIKGLEWDIVPTDEDDKADYGAAIKTVKKFFEKPDRVNPFDTWLGMLLEDMLVIDALTIYKRRTRNGELYSLEPVDGATIKVLIDPYGRIPDPPDPAYQQIVHGMVWTEFSRDEILYKPERRRTRSPYGYSRVESVILRVNIALRKATYELQYYTEGNIPDAFGKLPETWTPDQIKEFQTLWDSFYEGQTANRRKVKWVPGGVGGGVTQLRQEAWPIDFDEFIARICAAAFGIAPTPFVRMMNRATASISAEQQMDVGLEPAKQFLATLLTETIQEDLNQPQLKFKFVSEAQSNRLEQAQVDQIYIQSGVLDPNEVRIGLGREPRDQPTQPVPQVPSNAGSTENAGLETSSAQAAGPAEADLKRWREKSLKAMKKGNSPGVIFTSAAIHSHLQKTVREALLDVETADDARDVFDQAFALLKAGSGKPNIRARLAAQRRIQTTVARSLKTEGERLADLAVKRAYP